jgi:hypothetical protein
MVPDYQFIWLTIVEHASEARRYPLGWPMVRVPPPNGLRVEFRKNCVTKMYDIPVDGEAGIYPPRAWPGFSRYAFLNRFGSRRPRSLLSIVLSLDNEQQSYFEDDHR